MMRTMNGENRPLIINEPTVEFEKQPVQIHHQDFKEITDSFRGIYGPLLESINEKPKDVNM